MHAIKMYEGREGIVSFIHFLFYSRVNLSSQLRIPSAVLQG
jgi:hypothetical protein